MPSPSSLAQSSARARQQRSLPTPQKNALLSAETAKDIEQIKANAQRTLERDKDHRHFRRERIEPMLAYLSLY